MKRLIVRTLEVLSSVIIVIMWVSGAVGGYGAAPAAGVDPWLGALGGLLGAFVFSSLLFGFLFVLLEMNENMRAIRQHMTGAPSKI